MEILIAKADAKDYTAIERLLIVTDGMRSDNVRSFIKDFNISHDTFYAWKRDLIEQVNLIWGENKTELKKLESIEEIDEEISALKEDSKKLHKEIDSLSRELEKEQLKQFRLELMNSRVPDEFKDKIPLKCFKTEVIQEVEKLQNINIEEACEALGIAVGTLRRWKREPHAQKKISDYPALCVMDTLLDNPHYGTTEIVTNLYSLGISGICENEIKILRKESIRYIKEHNIRKRPLRYEFEDVNIAWAMDFKYIKILNKTFYLFKIIDDRSRLDICSSLVGRATTRASLELLEKAIGITGTKPILLKTDRGSQFKKMFGRRLEKLGIYHLKSIPYFPKCNAKIERIFRDVEINVCKNIPENIVYEDVKQLLDNESVRHNESPHMSLNGLSPKAFYQKFIEIQNLVKNGVSSIVEKIEECKLFKTFKRVVRKIADFIPGTKIDINVITYQM